MRFWWTPTSRHQIRLESGSVDSNGRAPSSRRIVQRAGLGLAQVHVAAGPAIGPGVGIEAPAAHVMRAGDDPGRIPSVTHARLTRWPLSVSTRTRSPLRTPIRAASSGWIQTGLRVGDLVEPLRVAGPGVDEDRQAERRDEGEVVRPGHPLAGDLAGDVGRDRELRPAPVAQRRGVELEASRRRREPAPAPRRRPSTPSRTVPSGPGAIERVPARR